MSRANLRRRLGRVENAAAQTCQQPSVVAYADGAAEASALAAELAAAFRGMIDHYHEVYKLPLAEAVARSGDWCPEYEERIRTGPPDELTWHALEALSQRDPDLAFRRWEEVKQAARKERRSGYAAGRALEGYGGSCWERARFLAVRAELMEAWQPRDAQERQLLDQMAQFQVLMEQWQETLTAYTMLAAVRGRTAKEKKTLELPRVSYAEVVEGAAAMVERMHRLYLRALQALQGRRRAVPPVVIRRAGQVNVAAQQINVGGRG
jgi:hypothetical protein